MSITRITDVIEPSVFTPYTIQRTMELSELIKSGIAQNDREFDGASQVIPMYLVNMPYWKDLTGDLEVMDDTGETSPGKIEAGKDMARKLVL